MAPRGGLEGDMSAPKNSPPPPGGPSKGSILNFRGFMQVLIEQLCARNQNGILRGCGLQNSPRPPSLKTSIADDCRVPHAKGSMVGSNHLGPSSDVEPCRQSCKGPFPLRSHPMFGSKVAIRYSLANRKQPSRSVLGH